MKQSYRMGLIAISVASMFGSYTHAATEAEERAKRQLALLQQKLEALQQGVAEQDKALRDANRRNVELMRELNSARTVIRWIGNNPAAIKKIGAESAGDEKPAAVADASARQQVAVEPAANEVVAVAVEPEAQPKPVATPEKPKVAVSELSPLKQVKAPSGKPAADSSFIQSIISDPLYLGGGAMVLGAGLAWGLTRRRRKDHVPMFEDSLLAHNPPTKHVVIGSTGGAVIDTTLAMNSMLKDEDLGDGNFDPSTIDPVAEAEVYLAYGRDSQAEEILLDALSKMPNRQDVRLKLLDIYASRGDLRGFETTLVEMQSVGVNKDDSIWKRVVELSAGFGPKNPLVGLEQEQVESPANATAAISPAEIASTPDFSVQPQARLGGEPDHIELALVGGAQSPLLSESEQESADYDLSVSRGLNLLQPEADIDDAFDAGAVEEDFSLPAESDAALKLSDSGESIATSSRINPDTLLNFDFDFDSEAQPQLAPLDHVQPPGVAETPVVQLDFGGISLDLESQPQLQADVVNEPHIELEMDDLQAQEEDPIDIKISLAKAYMDMGDRDSANEILQEVLDEGNASQGKLAREMIEEMRSAV